jgi:hypothetical protein
MSVTDRIKDAVGIGGPADKDSEVAATKAERTATTAASSKAVTRSAAVAKRAKDLEAKTAPKPESAKSEALKVEDGPKSVHGQIAEALAPDAPEKEKQKSGQQQFGAGGGIAAGSTVSYTDKSGVAFPAQVVAYHPAIPDNADIGLTGRGAMVDLMVYTGHPGTDGRIRVEAVPVSQVGLG